MNANLDPVEIEVTEDDLRLAMSELYNSGYFELVGADGARVILVSKDREAAG